MSGNIQSSAARQAKTKPTIEKLIRTGGAKKRKDCGTAAGAEGHESVPPVPPRLLNSLFERTVSQATPSRALPCKSRSAIRAGFKLEVHGRRSGSAAGRSSCSAFESGGLPTQPCAGRRVRQRS